MASIEFGRQAFATSDSIGDSGMRFGDTIETGWPLNGGVFGYTVPTGKLFTAQALNVALFADQGANLSGCAAGRLGTVRLYVNGVQAGEWVQNGNGPLQVPGSGNGHMQGWSPDYRAVPNFGDGILIPAGQPIRLDFTPLSATSCAPTMFKVGMSGIEGGVTNIQGASTEVTLNSAAAQTVFTYTPTTDYTLLQLGWQAYQGYYITTMLIVRVNGSNWIQSMNVGTAYLGGGTTPWTLTLPLYGVHFHEGDRIAVGAHTMLGVGNIVTCHLVGEETTVESGGSSPVIVRRPGTHLRF